MRASISDLVELDRLAAEAAVDIMKKHGPINTRGAVRVIEAAAASARYGLLTVAAASAKIASAVDDWRFLGAVFRAEALAAKCAT